MLSQCLSVHTFTFVSGERMLSQWVNLEASFNLKEGKRKVIEMEIIVMSIRKQSNSSFASHESLLFYFTALDFFVFIFLFFS